MYIYIYIYRCHIYIYIYIYVYTYICICVYLSLSLYIYIYMYTMYIQYTIAKDYTWHITYNNTYNIWCIVAPDLVHELAALGVGGHAGLAPGLRTLSLALSLWLRGPEHLLQRTGYQVKQRPRHGSYRGGLWHPARWQQYYYTYTYTCVYIYMCIHLSLSLYIYIYIYTYIHLSLYIYIYIYIYTLQYMYRLAGHSTVDNNILQHM